MADFHFIRPLWLIALLALALIIFLLKKYRVKQSSWQSILPPHLAKVLIKDGQQQRPLSLLLPSTVGLLTIVALAGPTWQKLPQPVYQVARGSVLIMDLSYSMYATDVSPNRLTRARFKAIDLLEQINEGEMGVVAYAGDAFTISPLTEDINNIKLLLPSLAPELMPALGSNPYAALTLAAEMLKNAGHLTGDIYWFTDGIDSEDIQDITDWGRQHNYQLNILGVGTSQGAPIKLPNGELMKGNDGAIVLPKLSENMLSGIAQRAGGNYMRLTNNNTDIDALTRTNLPASAINQEQTKQAGDNSFGDQWQDMGPYLLLPVLCLLLYCFRRGVLLSTTSLSLLFLSSTLTPKPASAGIWQDLWQTKNQQGQAKFDQQRFSEAANDFSDPLWKGSAHYKAGDFEAALAEFKKFDSASALYNQGNAFAKLQQFDQAIDAYQQALAKQPNFKEASDNKALIEQLQQQQQQQNQSGDGEGEGEQNQDQQSSDQQSQNQNQNQQGANNNQGEQSQQGQEQENSTQQSGDDNQENQAQQSPQQDNSPQQNSSPEQNNSPEQNDSDESQQANAENADTEHGDENNQQDSAEQQNQQQEQSNEQQAQTAQQQAAEQQEGEQATSEAEQIAAKLAQEQEQKHQQILNKVTDDPYLLLRNKMQIEYKKRQLEGHSLGDQKKW